MEIQDGKVNVTMRALFLFKNPFREEFDTLRVEVDLTCTIKLELLDNFIISGQITNLTMNVVDLKTFFKTRVKTTDLDT